MNQVLYILLGWLLGLLSPKVIDTIKSDYRKKEFFKALCIELHDLQYRIALVGFQLAQKYGELDKEYLMWIKPIIENYNGNEPSESVGKLIDSLINADEAKFAAGIAHMRSEKGVGLSLKTYSASFFEFNLGELSKLPVCLQLKIHEFMNQLNYLNQDIIKTNEINKMTFDSSITEENHDRLIGDLNSRYAFMQGICKSIVDKLDAILYEKL